MWTVNVLYSAYAEAGEHAGAYAIHIKYDNIYILYRGSTKYFIYRSKQHNKKEDKFY